MSSRGLCAKVEDRKKMCKASLLRHCFSRVSRDPELMQEEDAPGQY